MAKKAGNVIVEDVPVSQEESSIPVLDLAPYVDDQKGIELRGNYEALKTALENRRDEIAKIKFSASTAHDGFTMKDR